MSEQTPAEKAIDARIDAAVALHAALDATIALPELSFDADTLPALVRDAAVRLPQPRPLPSETFGAVVTGRRSRYQVAKRSLDPSELSDVLHHAWVASPTAGGLRELRLYALVLDRCAESIESGAYRYDPAGMLETVRAGDITGQVRASFLQPEFAERYPVLLLVVADLRVAFAKYALRHYRTIHVDAGILIHSLSLVTEILGLSGCAVAGFSDARLAQVADLAPHQRPVMAFALGHR